MRWANPTGRLPDLRRVIDTAHLYNRVLNKNRTILDGHGTPVTYWRNLAYSKEGRSPYLDPTAIKCYCWDAQATGPDKNHFLCLGTGWLTHSWQKYGYAETILSTPSPVTKDPKIILTGERNSAYTLSGNALSGDIVTERITLTKFIEVNHLLLNDSVIDAQNRVEYYYSLDDVNWITIPTAVYTETKLANRIGTLVLATSHGQTSTGYIRFKIKLVRRNAASSPPKWNSLRFRYRTLKPLVQLDPRFDTLLPAFLASRESPRYMIKQGPQGWDTTQPVRWWTLPEANIEEPDIIMFLQGEFANQRYEVQNMTKYTFGPMTQLLHKAFETRYIRDEDALGGIIHLLI